MISKHHENIITNDKMLRVLLVDDEADIVRTLKRGLEKNGFIVDGFTASTEASLQDANQYDVAILDIRMPAVNGFELARTLWKQNDKLQVCFLTAFDIYAREAAATMPSLKTHCFLTKPITPTALAKHIQSHFETDS